MNKKKVEVRAVIERKIKEKIRIKTGIEGGDEEEIVEVRARIEEAGDQGEKVAQKSKLNQLQSG